MNTVDTQTWSSKRSYPRRVSAAAYLGLMEVAEAPSYTTSNTAGKKREAMNVPVGDAQGNGLLRRLLPRMEPLPGLEGA
jgi:hypothetical protein